MFIQLHDIQTLAMFSPVITNLYFENYNINELWIYYAFSCKKLIFLKIRMLLLFIHTCILKVCRKIFLIPLYTGMSV